MAPVPDRGDERRIDAAELAVRAGFERWYGFLSGEDQWYPDLVYDNHPVDQPKSPAEGYHLTRT